MPDAAKPRRRLLRKGCLFLFYVMKSGRYDTFGERSQSRRKFSSEDLRPLDRMGRFASAAYQNVE